jgi:hypothetical protein
MRSGPIVAIAVLLSLALILPGCGDKETATGDGKEDTSAPAATPSPARGGVRASKLTRSAATKRCGAELGDFLDSIESLGNTLAVGLDYEQYLGSVNRVRASYLSVAVDRLGIVCLSRVASPAEHGLNVYIDAANLWGNCLANTSCDPSSIEATLQREWEESSALLSRARRALHPRG